LAQRANPASGQAPGRLCDLSDTAVQRFPAWLHLSLRMSTFLHLQLPTGAFEQACTGNRDGQEALYRMLATPVYTLLRRLVVRPAIAEELLQEVFIEVLRNLHDCQGPETFPGWVRSVAVNKAMMHLRSPWHRALLPLGGDVLHTQPAPPDNEADAWSAPLERALNALPAVSRAIVWLHDVEGYTHGEIARLYRRTPGFSRSQLSRAHEALRAHLEPTTGELSCTLASRN
jgi:RNA polymerase sigma-70 factor (ECF subfamily)